MKIVFCLILAFLNRAVASSRRRQEDTRPYCLGREGEGDCQQCVGTPYTYTRTYQYGKPITLTGCCKRGVFYNNMCHQNSFLDKNGELCRAPMGLSEHGECYMTNPWIFNFFTIAFFIIFMVPLLILYIFSCR